MLEFNGSLDQNGHSVVIRMEPVLKVEWPQCCNLTLHHAASTLSSKDVMVVFQRCGSCVPKM